MSNQLSTSTNPPLVTAVITTYNRAQIVRCAIKSVLAQTYEPLEIIVVEDGSDSGVEVWLQEEGLNHVRYVRHEENRGLAAGRNTGLKLANGEYIAYLDDDDEWKPERIERQMQRLEQLSAEERDRLGVIYCGNERRNLDNTPISVSHPRNKGNLREAITREGASTLSSVFLFSKLALESVGGFDEALPSSIDHDIWMSLAVHGYHAHVVDEPLVITYARQGPNTMMTDTHRRIQGVRMFVKKWEPTYHEWFGKMGGTAYAQRYFTRVIASLAANKLAKGNLSEAWQAVRAVFEYSDRTRYNFQILMKYTLLEVTRRFLSHKIVNGILDLLKQLRAKGNKFKTP